MPSLPLLRLEDLPILQEFTSCKFLDLRNCVDYPGGDILHRCFNRRRCLPANHKMVFVPAFLDQDSFRGGCSHNLSQGSSVSPVPDPTYYFFSSASNFSMS